jgi:hypothetical protein
MHARLSHFSMVQIVAGGDPVHPQIDVPITVNVPPWYRLYLPVLMRNF